VEEKHCTSAVLKKKPASKNTVPVLFCPFNNKEYMWAVPKDIIYIFPDTDAIETKIQKEPKMSKLLRQSYEELKASPTLDYLDAITELPVQAQDMDDDDVIEEDDEDDEDANVEVGDEDEDAMVDEGGDEEEGDGANVKTGANKNKTTKKRKLAGESKPPSAKKSRVSYFWRHYICN
jgi:hypothetical protein